MALTQDTPICTPEPTGPAVADEVAVEESASDQFPRSFLHEHDTEHTTASAPTPEPSDDVDCRQALPQADATPDDGVSQEPAIEEPARPVAEEYSTISDERLDAAINSVGDSSTDGNSANDNIDYAHEGLVSDNVADRECQAFDYSLIYSAILRSEVTRQEQDLCEMARYVDWSGSK
jgi:hypothetical protein